MAFIFTREGDRARVQMATGLREIFYPANLTMQFDDPQDLTCARLVEHEIEAPSWKGEGLPPVGTTCEWQAAGQRIWVPVTVVFSSNWVLVVRDVNPHPEGPVDIAIDLTTQTDDKFRPIRTAEQIAGEERRASIYAIESVILGGQEQGLTITQIAAAIHDAGYCKKVTK